MACVRTIAPVTRWTWRYVFKDTRKPSARKPKCVHRNKGNELISIKYPARDLILGKDTENGHQSNRHVRFIAKYKQWVIPRAKLQGPMRLCRLITRQLATYIIWNLHHAISRWVGWKRWLMMKSKVNEEQKHMAYILVSSITAAQYQKDYNSEAGIYTFPIAATAESKSRPQSRRLIWRAVDSRTPTMDHPGANFRKWEITIAAGKLIWPIVMVAW